jgi:hypothetical protein
VPHAGFPVLICQSVSYRRSGNLTIPDVNTNGIDISADDVTLDLNGFAMVNVNSLDGILFRFTR